MTVQKNVHALTVPANITSYRKGVFGTGIKVRMSLWGDYSGLSRWPSMQPQVSLKEGARGDSQPKWERGGEGGAESVRMWASDDAATSQEAQAPDHQQLKARKDPGASGGRPASLLES